MYFEATKATSLDARRDVEFYRPRVESLNDSDAVAFNFTVRHGQSRRGFSCNGRTIVNADRSVRWEFLFCEGSSFSHAIALARELAPDLDESQLIDYLSEGILLTFAAGTSIFRDTEYVVLATTEVGGSGPFDVAKQATIKSMKVNLTHDS